MSVTEVTAQNQFHIMARFHNICSIFLGFARPGDSRSWNDNTKVPFFCLSPSYPDILSLMLLYTPKNRAKTHTTRWIPFYKHFSWFIFSYFRGWCWEPTPDIQRKERKSFILNFHVKFLISSFSFPFSFQVLIFEFSIFEFYTWKVFSFYSFFSFRLYFNLF